MTAHKSQGLEFDMILVHASGLVPTAGRQVTGGLLYTAVSRVTTASGLDLDTPKEWEKYEWATLACESSKKFAASLAAGLRGGSMYSRQRQRIMDEEKQHMVCCLDVVALNEYQQGLQQEERGHVHGVREGGGGQVAEGGAQGGDVEEELLEHARKGKRRR